MSINYDLTQLQLSAGTHEIKVKARAEGYQDSNFSNQVSYVIPQTNYSVSFTIGQQRTYAKDWFRIYDGQNNTGTLLYESTSQSSETLTPTVICQSGYLYIEAEGSIVDIEITSVSSGITQIFATGQYDALFKVEANGTITGYVDYED